MFHNLIVSAKVPTAWLEDQYGPDWQEFPGLPEHVEPDGDLVTFTFALSGACDAENGELAWDALVYAWESGAVTHSVDS